MGAARRPNRSGVRTGAGRVGLALLIGTGVTTLIGRAYAADDPSSAAGVSGSADTVAGPWSVFAQVTNVTQWHPRFDSPYRGPLSLYPGPQASETTDVTLYAGVRLWTGAAAYLSPEIDQGFGLSNTTGVAGFPSGEAYKIGANAPYLRLPRAFVRQVIELGGQGETLAAGPDQVGAVQQANNVTLTLGKFSVVDVFDTNDYAHDPRHDFLNWSVIDAGAFDYAADSWGFTYGGALEWTDDWWTARAGIFDLSTIPNGKQPDPRFAQYEAVSEFEGRHQWLGHPGKLKLLAFVNHGRMASYSDALALALQNGSLPALAPVRHFQSRDGIALNFQQELANGVGLFARASTTDGRKEAYEFTDIDDSISAGLSVQGDRWDRHGDTLGFALVENALSTQARDYFNAGGLGILIGDGRLNYGSEQISETYYSLRLFKGVSATLDYQFVEHPAYNRARGPVSIVGVRLHAEI